MSSPAAPVRPAPGAVPLVHAVPARARAKHAANNPLESIGSHIPLPIPVPDWSKPIILALLALAVWFGVRYGLSARRARRLEQQRAGLLADLGVLQAALVPEVPPRLGGLAISVAYRPAEGPAAGGDFYDVFAPGPGKVAIMLGDVAGHGHEALTHAALTRYTLRAYLQAGLEPRAVLALAGRVLVDRTGERYATVALGVYDSENSTLTYALAGHPPPILLGPRPHPPLTLCSSPPIGWGMPTGRRQTTVSLPAGAGACFFSDGLIEARCKGELLGRDRLGQILAGLGSRPQAAAVLEQVRALARGTPDDMLACVLSPESAAAAAESAASDRFTPRVEELEVDGHALGSREVKRFLEACALPASRIARSLALASEIAAACDAALIRVQFGPDGAAVSVSAVDSTTPQPTITRTSPATAQPLLHALSSR